MRKAYLIFLSLIFSFSLKARQSSTVIGTQTWMTKNLDVNHFRNGDTIAEFTAHEQWQQAWVDKTPGYCYYEFKKENGVKYGKLYNYYAITDPRGLAPEGWHIPMIAEWDTLVAYLVKEEAFVKIVDRSGWINGLKPTTNASGLSVLAGGSGGRSGFGGVDIETIFWSYPRNVKDYTNLMVMMIGVFHDNQLARAYGMEKEGMYVRCVKDGE